LYNNKIDWEDFKDTYNQMHKTEFKTAEEWITFLYNKHDKFVSPLSKELGVSFVAVTAYLKRINIWERKSKGGNNYKNRPVGKKEILFLNIPEKTMKDLTKFQICARCTLSKHRCTKLISKHKRKYTKSYGDSSNEWA
jgi:hypothetical protein